MLKLAGGGAPPVPPTEDPDMGALPEQLAAASQPAVMPGGDATQAPKFSADKVGQDVVHYLGSESGPFECQSCVFFQGPNGCSIVDGDIDPQGVCNLFTSASGDQEAPPDEESPVEDSGEVEEEPTDEQPVQ